LPFNRNQTTRYGADPLDDQELATKAYVDGSGSGKTIATLIKSADESVTSSTTLQDDDELTFVAEANTNYLILLLLRANGAAAGDLRSAVSVPAGASFGIMELIWRTDNPAVEELINFQSNLDGTDRLIPTWVMVSVGATAGTVAYSWAQWVSNATPTIVTAGSTMIVWKNT